jgi:hypothetical protein
MNAWKCIYCDAWAGYMLNGNSVCKECLDKFLIKLGKQK